MSELLRQADRREDTNFDKIYRWYIGEGEVELNNEQQKLRKRWENIWRLFGGYNTPTKIVRKHKRVFSEISERTAWQDLRNAKALFGDPSLQNRAAERQRLNIILLRAMKKAEKDRDWKALARLTDQYRKNNLLDKDDNGGIEDLLEHFKPHQFVFSNKDPEELKREAEELMKDVPAVDAEFTIVSDDES
ncbi:hypothetical protein GBO34_00785 [Roseivirga pacifica]|uniref:hypothetical protein n=1 Tax=Roseivirga pacifica TaxID=1267423 RepID=UPI002094DE74|nr:hypothetical protein [Roseivirga pacifica]MCO6367848.1 hypothetical protein [Roseivirga pacifica]MCO6377220.1 hypothetical protein [Roseivirga pacifica]